MDKLTEAIINAKMEECKNDEEAMELLCDQQILERVLDGDEIKALEKAKEERRAYYKNYYENHKEQYRRNIANYWIRKAEKNGK